MFLCIVPINKIFQFNVCDFIITLVILNSLAQNWNKFVNWNNMVNHIQFQLGVYTVFVILCFHSDYLCFLYFYYKKLLSHSLKTKDNINYALFEYHMCDNASNCNVRKQDIFIYIMTKIVFIQQINWETHCWLGLLKK